MLLRAAANDRPIDAKPRFDVFLAEILEELLQVAHDAALETLDEFAAFVRDADKNLTTVFRMAGKGDKKAPPP